jgi:multidrug efflux pump subunit AcrA (membrane-fusion protein)
LGQHLIMIEFFQNKPGRRANLAAMPRLALAATMAAAATMVGAIPSDIFAAERDAAQGEMAVTVVKAKRECFVDTLQVTGVLTPTSEVLVRPDREGLQISQVLVDPGETVSSGQVMARLAPPEGQTGSTIAVQAPTAGLVTARTAVVGTMASARAEPLFRIAAKGEMELLAETTVKSLASIAPDQPAKIGIIGVGELSGKVRMASKAISPTTQLGQVRVFVGSDPRLRVGAFGRASIELGRRCGPAIPLSAVLYSQGGAVVQVVRDGSVETRRVTVGLLAKGQAEIREGLAEGDVVVVRAGAFVRDGDRIRSITAAEPSAKR